MNDQEKKKNRYVPISICIITKNECSTLEKCLKHLFPITQKNGHEIVIVDTGSKDNTLDMCKTFTQRIYEFIWINDFSAARNYAASKASNDWILCIDSDEFLKKWDEALIQDSIALYPNGIGGIRIFDTCGNGSNQYQSTNILYRLYNKKQYHFERSIHEQIVPISPETKILTFNVPIEIDHASYSGSQEHLTKKAHRNIDLLKNELKKNPHDPYLLFQLGQSYYMLEDYATACHYYSLGLEEDVDPRMNYVCTMVVSYGYTLLNLKQYQKALELEGIYDVFCSHADYVFLMGMVYMNNGLFEDAINQFEKATTLNNSEVIGANSFRAWHNIGVIYECTNQKEKAILYYKKCGDFAPAKARIKNIEGEKHE